MGLQGPWTGQFFVFVLIYFGPESTFDLRDAFNAGTSPDNAGLGRRGRVLHAGLTGSTVPLKSL